VRFKNLIAGLAIFTLTAVPALVLAGPSCGTKASACSGAKKTASACSATKSACSSSSAKVENVKIGIPQINTAALKLMMATNVDMTLIDARSAKYDDGRRIGNAQTLTAGASAEEVANVISSKDELVVAYCSSVKCPASKKLMAHLNKLGYKNVVVYEEGIAGWFDEDHSNELPVINTTAFMAMHNANTTMAILDARGCDTAEDCKKAGHIPGAKELTDKSTMAEIQKVLPDKDQLVVTYCGSAACPASEKLAAHLNKMGYTNVVIYKEGIAGWTTVGGELAQL